jgi:membrane-associated phospholipid phosphatase
MMRLEIWMTTRMSDSSSMTLLQRSRTLTKDKLAAFAFVTIWIGTPYFGLQYLHLFPVTPMPRLAIDRLIPFNDNTIWIYLSMYLLLPLAAILPKHRYQLRQCVLGSSMIGLVSALVFLFFPTSIQRPSADIINQSNWCYRLTVQMDQPVNACPSLHASLCVFAAILCHNMLSQASKRWLWRSILWLWVLAILYSTLSTRQHVFIDIAIGAALAPIAYSLVHYIKPMAQLTAVPEQ